MTSGLLFHLPLLLLLLLQLVAIGRVSSRAHPPRSGEFSLTSHFSPLFCLLLAAISFFVALVFFFFFFAHLNEYLKEYQEPKSKGKRFVV